MNYLIDRVKQNAMGVKLKNIPYDCGVYRTLQLKSEDVTVTWVINKLRLLAEDGHCNIQGKEISILPDQRIIIRSLLNGLIASLLKHIAEKLKKH